MTTKDETFVQKNVALPQSDLDRFDELHPGHGSYTWFARACLSAYIRLYDETPDDRVEEVALHIKDSASSREKA